MSNRAEEASLKTYPKEDSKMWHSAFGTFEFDKNAQARKAFQQGYEQAEKDYEPIIQAAIHAYESWKGGTMDMFISDMDKLGELIEPLRKELLK